MDKLFSNLDVRLSSNSNSVLAPLTKLIAPRRNDVATPKLMQMIEKLSTISPSLPKTFLPNTGYSIERIVNGKPVVVKQSRGIKGA